MQNANSHKIAHKIADTCIKNIFATKKAPLLLARA